MKFLQIGDGIYNTKHIAVIEKANDYYSNNGWTKANSIKVVFIRAGDYYHKFDTVEMRDQMFDLISSFLRKQSITPKPHKDEGTVKPIELK